MISFLQKKQKLFLSSVLVLELLFSSALPASAGLFSKPSVPSPSSVFSDMEKRYHLDTGTIQNFGEGFNVSDNKQPSPEVTIFFSPSDPKAGEKITAKAFPMFFSNSETSLYYTWYIKHVGCDLTNNPSASAELLCDQNNDGRITVEDWKIEAASIGAKNGFDTAEANYGTASDDNDGYKARFGGDNKVSTPDHCYILDSGNGKIYELGESDKIDFDCPDGTTPVCMVGEGQLDPQESCTTTDPYLDPDTGDLIPGVTDCPPLTFSDTGVCQISGTPICTGSGEVQCGTGSARCVKDPRTSTACGTALSTCSGGGEDVSTYCRHLFPQVPGHTSGDGSFSVNEEKFWGTNPEDPGTADNGNKDEANVVGLGRNSFTWNYISGDQVGVVVEGTSMVATKYNDSSSMIMWAFSKKDCPLSLANGTGSFARNIKGYSVTMLSADFDLNKCLERNLVDPAQGGQATNLEVSLSSALENAVNDESDDEGGDVVSVQASVANAARSMSEILFEWRVELSNNIQFKNGAGLVSADVTNDLKNYGLLANYKGIALDTLRVNLNIKNNPAKLLGGRKLSEYLVEGVGYLRFTSKASESFASGVVRKGKSDVIAKFTSTGKKISAYKVMAEPRANGAMRVKLPNPLLPGLICNDNALDRSACRVIKNEVIGLRVDPTGLSNFKWMINGAPLTCDNSTVSSDCLDESANEINFFPVSGDVGDTYTVTVTANDVTSNNANPNRDKTITLSRSFHVIKPTLNILSSDLTLAWPKFLGQYKDVEGAGSTLCPNGLCNEFSESVLEGFSGENLTMRGEFIPNFLAAGSVRQWTVDGAIVSENTPPVTGGAITFTASKPASGIYNIALTASVVQSQGIRQALRDIWGISPLDSPEIHFATSAQVELQEPGFAQGKLEGSKKYFAAIASYIPASVMFSFRIFLSVVLMLFTAHFLFSLIPERVLVSQPEQQKRNE